MILVEKEELQGILVVLLISSPINLLAEDTTVFLCVVSLLLSGLYQFYISPSCYPNRQIYGPIKCDFTSSYIY